MFRKIVLVSALMGMGLAACGGDDDDDGSNNATGGTVQVTASGEVLALGGYAFPPAVEDDPAFVDGWEVTFEKLLVTFDHISLSEGADTSPSDQSQMGQRVAQLDGPWAVDLHQGGPLTGKGGSDEQAYPIAVFENQNLNDNKAFDPTVRYAFSFDSVPASADATRLQIAADDTDYADMITNGWVVLYKGTATWKGGDSCTTTNAGFDFTRLPTTVHFRFGFKSPTSYLNCQNPDNDPADPLGDEEHQRGVQVRSNAQTIAQVTFHTDHPFWESFLHDSAARFDALAAIAKQDASGEWSVELSDAEGVDYHAFEYDGEALPYRSCLDTAPLTGKPSQVSYDDQGITQSDFADYMTYDQSTQGHMNSDGLCFVSHNF